MANSTTVNSRVDYNDEVERSFYERTSKLKYKRYYGKTKYYDFELWYKCHYQNPTPYKTYQNRNPYQYTWVKNNLEPNVKPRIHVMYLSLGGVIIMFYYYFMH